MLAKLVKSVEVVNPGGVSIAPVNLKRIAPDGLNTGRANVGIDRFASDDSLSRVFVHAARAGALKTKLDVGEDAFGPIAPAHEKLFRAVRFDFQRNRFQIHSRHHSSIIEVGATLM